MFSQKDIKVTHMNVAKAAASIARSRYPNKNNETNVTNTSFSDQTTAALARQRNNVFQAANAAATIARSRYPNKNNETNVTNTSFSDQNQKSKIERIFKWRSHQTFLHQTFLHQTFLPNENDYESNKLFRLINTFNWKEVNLFLKNERETLTATNQNLSFLTCCTFKKKKSTPLHCICSIGSAPIYTMKLVLEGWPRAASLQDRFGNTPLHEECKNSQKSFEKVHLLIQTCVESVSILNHLGQSPLHIACMTNAMLPVITQLIQTNPNMLLVEDNHGNLPVMLLWRSWQRNIPGMLAIKSGNTSFGPVKRLWEKMSYLTVKTYSMTHTTDHNQIETYNKYLIHAILHLKICPMDFLGFAIMKHPEFCKVKDENGNLPLHNTLSLHIYATKFRYYRFLQQMLKAYPQAAQIPNGEGRFPLHIAIETGKSWEYGIKDLFDAAPNTVMVRDLKTCFFPFMLVAISKRKEQRKDEDVVNTIYNLLRVQPHVIRTYAV